MAIDYKSVLFAATLSKLGREGFAKWMIDSFSGGKVGPAEGNFGAEEEQFWGVGFSTIRSDLSDEAIEMVVYGLEAAFKEFSVDSGNYENLYNLAAIAESFSTEVFLLRLPIILEAWVPPQSQGRENALPQTEKDTYCLRETLEVAFRALVVEPRSVHPGLTRLGKWASDALIHRPGLRSLVPAWAPMYVLGRHFLISVGEHKKANALDSVLKLGYKSPDDEFEGFFRFKEEEKEFPYALSRILQHVDEWISATRPSTLTNRFEGPLFNESPRTSATLGGVLVSPQDLRDDMGKEHQGRRAA